MLRWRRRRELRWVRSSGDDHGGANDYQYILGDDILPHRGRYHLIRYDIRRSICLFIVFYIVNLGPAALHATRGLLWH